MRPERLTVLLRRTITVCVNRLCTDCVLYRIITESGQLS